MKVVCLLTCLTLARLSAGHIFRQQYMGPNMDYINSLQLQNQLTHGKYNTYSEGRQKPIVQRQKSEERSSEEASGMVRYRLKYQQEQDQYKNQDQYRYQEDSLYQPQKSQYQMKDKEQKYTKPEKQTKQKKYQLNQYTEQRLEKIPRYQDSEQLLRDSIESKSNERFTEEKYAVPMYGDILKTRTKPTKQYRMPVSGDPISWRGIQIATGGKVPVDRTAIEKIFIDAYDTMNHVSKEEKKIFHRAVEEAAYSENEDVHLNATQLLNKYQYPVETHMIKTEDGYLLTLFHIPAKQQIPQKPVVFLMHGLLGSADDWLLMGPGKSLAYLLSDAGYDVWLGNARGSKYSRRHVTKHPVQPEFWHFSTDDIALYDLPSMIDYVLLTSNQQKLYYVGHSQGTTAFFALASTRPEYNDKIIMMYALSPMVYMSNVRSPLLRMIAPSSQFSEVLSSQLSEGEFKPSMEVLQTVGGVMCQNEIGCRNICSNVNFVMSGANVQHLDAKLIPVIMGHLPAGASNRQMKQYAQAVASQQFTKYDYGADINERVYGSRQPPQYEMQKVQAPVALYYSEEDWLASPLDVARLERELPNVKESYKVPETHFTNMDFQFSKVAPEVVYQRLIQSIQQQETNTSTSQDTTNYVY